MDLNIEEKVLQEKWNIQRIKNRRLDNNKSIQVAKMLENQKKCLNHYENNEIHSSDNNNTNGLAIVDIHATASTGSIDIKYSK